MYGLKLQFIDCAGVSTPASVAAIAICDTPLVEYWRGRASGSTLHSSKIGRAADVDPQVCGPAARYRSDLKGMIIQRIAPLVSRRLHIPHRVGS